MDELGEIEAAECFGEFIQTSKSSTLRLPVVKEFFRKFEKNKSILKKKNRRRKQDS